MKNTTGINFDVNEKEVRQAIEKLNTLKGIVSTRARNKVLRDAAKPLIEKAKQNIGNANKPVKRYDTPKVIGKIKAPKGSGKVVATYYPGNLREAIKAMKFRRSNDIFVGPKYKKGSTKGDFGPGKGQIDGWYAHFVEYGTINAAKKPFMLPAFRSTANIVSGKIIKGVEALFKKHIGK